MYYREAVLSGVGHTKQSHWDVKVWWETTSRVYILLSHCRICEWSEFHTSREIITFTFPVKVRLQSSNWLQKKVKYYLSLKLFSVARSWQIVGPHFFGGICFFHLVQNRIDSVKLAGISFMSLVQKLCMCQ